MSLELSVTIDREIIDRYLDALSKGKAYCPARWPVDGKSSADALWHDRRPARLQRLPVPARCREGRAGGETSRRSPDAP